jgi:hypothetical protein
MSADAIVPDFIQQRTYDPNEKRNLLLVKDDNLPSYGSSLDSRSAPYIYVENHSGRPVVVTVSEAPEPDWTDCQALSTLESSTTARWRKESARKYLSRRLREGYG